MYPGVSPASANMGALPAASNPVLGAAGNPMNSMPGMGVMPASMGNPYFPVGGMNY
jgi:hypothetical protein